MRKYRNKNKICRQSHFHDSMKEAGFCDDLELRKRAHDILDYKIQQKHVLLEAFVNSEGKKIRPITYTPDFIVFHNGLTEIIDVKGGHATQTQAWVLKWKILQSKLTEKGRYKFTIV